MQIKAWGYARKHQKLLPTQSTCDGVCQNLCRNHDYLYLMRLMSQDLDSIYLVKVLEHYRMILFFSFIVTNCMVMIYTVQNRNEGDA